MAAYIAHGHLIPDSEFSCPLNSSGIDYPSIPWSNMSVATFYDDIHEETYKGYCGVKGPHPRMAYCCQHGQLQEAADSNAAIALAPEDHCSQYCGFFIADIDLWVYCLTQEGDSVSNAFCRSDDGAYLETSGTEPLSGPANPDSQLIKDKKNKYSAAASLGPSSLAVWLSLLTLVAAGVGSLRI